MTRISLYYNTDKLRAAVRAGRHREKIGGLWDEIGSLQLSFMISQGLKPHHRMVDIGCGCLRGGVRFVDYLEPGHYYGVDLSQDLLDAGFDIELSAAGLQHKLPREHLIATNIFDFSAIEGTVDFAFAQSLFTHLPMNHIRNCLARLPDKMTAGGVFFATFFERPDEHPIHSPSAHAPGNVVTTGLADPYNYSFQEFSSLTNDLPWTLRNLGDWNHPRAQRMLRFEYGPR